MSTIARLDPPAAQHRPVVIALHCSGASGRQWRPLAEALGPDVQVIAPDLFGSPSRGPWPGAGRFGLRDEAALVHELIDAAEGPVHLVGHSYGGGVALRAAIARANRIASVSLYEPSAFHLLKSMGPDGRALLGEIKRVAAEVRRAVEGDNCDAAARAFVDYWNGAGAWAALRPDVQADLARYIPKACLEFRALIDERMPLAAYRRVQARWMLLQGDAAPAPSAAIVQRLTGYLKPALTMTVAGAGHMGPLTHPDIVAAAIAAHIRASEPRLAAQPAAERLKTAA